MKNVIVGLLIALIPASSFAKIYFSTKDCYMESKNNINICVQNNTNEDVGRSNFLLNENIIYVTKNQQSTKYVIHFFMPNRYIDISASTTELEKSSIAKITYSFSRNGATLPGCNIVINAKEPKRFILQIAKKGDEFSCR